MTPAALSSIIATCGLGVLGLAGSLQKAQPRLTTGPVSYFATHCARCHGPNGSYYDSQSLGKLTDARLRQFVKDMSEGAGNAPIKGADLDAQVAYHRAMIRNKPFVAIVNFAGGSIKGEAFGTPAVWAGLGSKRVKATVKEDGSFRIPASPGTKLYATEKGPAELQVGKDLFNQRTP